MHKGEKHSTVKLKKKISFHTVCTYGMILLVPCMLSSLFFIMYTVAVISHTAVHMCACRAQVLILNSKKPIYLPLDKRGFFCVKRTSILFLKNYLLPLLKCAYFQRYFLFTTVL